MLIKRFILTGFFAVFIGLITPAFTAAQQPLPIEGDEATLIKILESDAPIFEKAKACQRLAVIGTRNAVPVLARYLSDEKMSHYARLGLEPNPDPAAGEALRAALDDLRGGLLVGVINSIGMRRDDEAVDKLRPLLDIDDAPVAAAAAQTLGQIASPQAIQLLLDTLDGNPADRIAVADACLTAADILMKEDKNGEAVVLFDALRKAKLPRHISLSALGGAIRARGADGLELLIEQLQSEDDDIFSIGLSMAHKLPGSEVTKALVAELDVAPPRLGEGKKELVILSAEYGAKETWIDVTDALIAAAQDDGLSIQAGNDLAGDPISDEVKSLRVSYRLDNELTRTVVQEGDRLEIEGTILRHPRQAKIISVLGERGDRAALAVVLDAAENGFWDVRLPATRVLATLGDASAVPVLLKTAATEQGNLASAVLDSLAALPGEQVDAALKAMLPDSTGQQKLAVIELMGRREVSSSVPDLFKLTEDVDGSIRTAAIAALGLTVDLEKLPNLAALLVTAANPENAQAVKEALKKACLRMPDRAKCTTILIKNLESAPPDSQIDFLDLLGVVGGPDALAYISEKVRRGDERMQDATTRVLGEWMTADAAPALLALAKSGNPKFRVRTLRGYVRIARQLDVPTDERIRMCSKALDTATRPQERQLILETLELYPTGGALAVVTRLVPDPQLKEAASSIAVTMAKKLVRTHPEIVVKAMTAVLEATSDKTVAENAKNLLNRAKRQLR